MQAQENKHKYLSEILYLATCFPYINATEKALPEATSKMVSKKDLLRKLQMESQKEKGDHS